MSPGTKGNWRRRVILGAVATGLTSLLVLAGVRLSGSTDAPAAPEGEVSRPAVKPYLNMPAQWPLTPGQWVAVNAFPALQFNFPTFVTFAPRSNLLFVCECAGVIKCFANEASAKEATTVLDISRQCQSGCDSGLLGLAFHPEFGKKDSPNRGYFYVAYNYTDTPVADPFTTKKATHNRLSRFTIPDSTLQADPGSETVLIDQFDEHCFHNGGSMFFHPDDGFLYLTLGDEGDARGSFGNCQRIDRDLFGGVIRIDVDRDPSRSHPPPRQPATGKTAHYYIPNDNPFVGMPGALEEFWCIGLRSPHRMSLDPVRKQIWLGDVGEGADPFPCEEINLIVKGGNYQWNYDEGGVPRPNFAAKPGTILGTEQPPVYAYAHTENRRCVIGGFVYRGAEHAAALGGKYIFGDIAGMVWAMTYRAGVEPVVEQLCTVPARFRELTSFGVDNRGEVYLCCAEGKILKLARAGSAAAPLPPGPPLPTLLSQTGAFSNLRQVTPAPGLIPYEVNLPFFSDNVGKQRWLALPFDPAQASNPTIKFAARGEWTFPPGTVLVKHFEMPLSDADPAAQQRLETRLLVMDNEGGVYGVAYKWRPDGSDAELVKDAHTETLTNGQQWYYPSSADCLVCHNPAAQYVLGVNARQLNRTAPHPFTGAPENQLQAWNRLKLFDHQVTDAEFAQCAKLANVADRNVPVEERARSYLDVNCAYCHRPAGVRAHFDARLETPLKKQKLIYGPVFSDLGIAGAEVISPRDPARSLLLVRMKACDAKKMPPLGRSIADDAGVQLIEEWVLTMSPTRLVLTRSSIWAGCYVAVCIPAWLLRRRLRHTVSLVRFAPLALILTVPGAMALSVVLHGYWGLLEIVLSLCVIPQVGLSWWFFGRKPRRGAVTRTPSTGQQDSAPPLAA